MTQKQSKKSWAYIQTIPITKPITKSEKKLLNEIIRTTKWWLKLSREMEDKERAKFLKVFNSYDPKSKERICDKTKKEMPSCY